MAADEIMCLVCKIKGEEVGEGMYICPECLRVRMVSLPIEDVWWGYNGFAKEFGIEDREKDRNENKGDFDENMAGIET